MHILSNVQQTSVTHFAELVNVYFSANCSDCLWQQTKMWFTSIQQLPQNLFWTGFASSLQKILPLSYFCCWLALESFTSEMLPLHRVALRGTLFIQNSSLLWTLASKLLSLSCLNRFLWKCVLFRKQNATTKGSYCWVCLACTQKTLISKCRPTHSDESIIPRLRHFPPHLAAHCASTPFAPLRLHHFECSHSFDAAEEQVAVLIRHTCCFIKFHVCNAHHIWRRTVQQSLIKVSAVVTVPPKSIWM